MRGYRQFNKNKQAAYLFPIVKIKTVEDLPKDAVIVESIMTKWAFQKEKIKDNREKIIALLAELPEEFRTSSKNKGASFLQAAEDKNGKLWGEHSTIEELFALGEAIGLVKCILPREAWSMLPSGMPYYSIELEITKET